MRNPGDGGKSYPTAKNLLISPIRKIPLNKFKSFAIKSYISSPSNSNFQVITRCNLHLQLQLFLLYHILNFKLYVYTCRANLTNQCLLNVEFSMTKALNNLSFPKQIFYSLHLSIPNAILKTLLLLMLVSLFSPLLFSQNLKECAWEQGSLCFDKVYHPFHFMFDFQKGLTYRYVDKQQIVETLSSKFVSVLFLIWNSQLLYIYTYTYIYIYIYIYISYKVFNRKNIDFNLFRPKASSVILNFFTCYISLLSLSL